MLEIDGSDKRGLRPQHRQVVVACAQMCGGRVDSASVFTLTGGLFQDFAPSAHHLQRVLVPLVRRMGLEAEVLVRRPGYVPEGNGVLEVRVSPAVDGLRPIGLTEQGWVTAVRGIGLSSHLVEQQVSDRMAEECWEASEEAGHEADIEAVYETSAGHKGADLTVWASEYVIPRVTEHVETNLWLVETILGAGTRLDGRCLRIEGVGHRIGAG